MAVISFASQRPLGVVEGRAHPDHVVAVLQRGQHAADQAAAAAINLVLAVINGCDRDRSAVGCDHQPCLTPTSFKRPQQVPFLMNASMQLSRTSRRERSDHREQSVDVAVHF